MTTKKTHEGKSALQLLNGARVSETRGGGFEIFLADGRACMRSADGDLLIRDQGSNGGEEWICIECAPRAYEQLAKLKNERDARFETLAEA